MTKFKYYLSENDEGTEIEATGYRSTGTWLVFYTGKEEQRFYRDSNEETEILRLKGSKVFKVERVDPPTAPSSDQSAT